MPAQSFDLGHDRLPLVSLDGPWHFHSGDSPIDNAVAGGKTFLWAEDGFDDSTWPLLSSNRSWSAQGYPAMAGYGWYRFTVRIPAGSPPASLLLAPIITSFQLFVDGHMVGGFGGMASNTPNARIRHEAYPLTDSPTTEDRIIHVSIRVWHSPSWASYLGGGMFTGGNLVGERSLVATQEHLLQVARDVIFVDDYAYSIAAGLVGLAILWLFFIRRAEREYLWFAVMLLSQAADCALNISKEIYAVPPIPVFDLLDGILAATQIFAAFCFFSRVLNAQASRVGRFLLIPLALSPLFCIAYWPGWASVQTGTILQLLFILPVAGWIFWLLGKCAIAGNQDARLLLIPTLLDLGFYVADNVAILASQLGLSRVPRIFYVPLAIPPFSIRPDILLHLVFLLAMLVFLTLRFSQARKREVWLAGEFEAARQIQQVLLPDEEARCLGFNVECIYQPAQLVGGDFFQQMADGHGGMLMVIGDVSGKGLPAAMLVSVLVGAIRTEASRGTDPVAMLRCLNERMLGRAHGGFTTCLATHIAADGQLTLANAGHLPPYLNGQEISVAGALPLGILNNPEFELASFQLTAGDRLTFVSDGVVEAQSKSGGLFGFEKTRVISLQPAAEIAEAAKHFGQSDDITVVTVEFSGIPVAAASAR